MSDNAMVPYSDVERMGAAIAKSGLFGIKTPEQAVALMLVAQAEGKHPAIVARDYDIIQGRPAKKAEAMQRDFLAGGGKIEWHVMTDLLADATFSHPAGGTLRVTWDMARATQAQLGGKDMWKKYPRQMLRARVISEGVRAVGPFATSGLYVPEEVRDFEPQRANGHTVIDAQPEPEKPEHYDQVMADLRALADEGTATLKEAWPKVPVAIRTYATISDKETWESIKAHAAQATAAVDASA